MSNSVSLSPAEVSSLLLRVGSLEKRVSEQDDKIHELMIRVGAVAYDSPSLTPVPSDAEEEAPSQVSAEVRKILGTLNQLSFQKKHAEIQQIAQEALGKNPMSDESRGLLLHKLAWAFFNAKDIRGAKIKVLEADDLAVSKRLKNNFLELRRKIDEADANAKLASSSSSSTKRSPESFDKAVPALSDTTRQARKKRKR